MTFHYHGLEGVKKALNIAVEKQHQDCDSVYAVVGLERSGKSIFTLNCDDYLGAEESSISMDLAQSRIILPKIKQKGIFHLDEAIAGGMFGRKAMTEGNMDMVETFVTIGKKNLISFMCMTDFFLLDVYFRKFRLAGLFHIYKRGKVAFYGRRAIRKICVFGEQTREIKGAKPYFTDTYPDYKGRLRAYYDKLEGEWKETRLKERFGKEKIKSDPKAKQIIRLLLDRKNPKTMMEIAKEVGCSAAYITQVRQDVMM